MPAEPDPGVLSLPRQSAPAAELQQDRPFSKKLTTTLLSALSSLRRSDIFGAALLRLFRAFQAAGSERGAQPFLLAHPRLANPRKTGLAHAKLRV